MYLGILDSNKEKKVANRPPQKAVRVGQFERTLEQFNREMAVKTSLTMAKFHELYVAPLERRILFLELLTGIRLIRWVVSLPGRIKAWFTQKFTEPVPEVAAAVPESVPEPIPEAEPEHDGQPRILTPDD